jgi:hypothetical protein
MVFNPKSQPAPACLAIEKAKRNGNYNCGDVLERLQEDFKNKCYICEQKAPISINTEHFVAHRGNIDLKFDWNNLFYCCAHCNNTKLAKPIYDKLLNCTIQLDGVDVRIKYHMKALPKDSNEKVTITPIETDEKVLNTIDLLLAVYNGANTPNKRIQTDNLRKNLAKELRRFHENIDNFYQDDIEKDEKIGFKKEIERLLRPRAAFIAFKKWIIRDNETLLHDFGEYL